MKRLYLDLIRITSECVDYFSTLPLEDHLGSKSEVELYSLAIFVDFLESKQAFLAIPEHVRNEAKNALDDFYAPGGFLDYYLEFIGDKNPTAAKNKLEEYLHEIKSWSNGEGSFPMLAFQRFCPEEIEHELLEGKDITHYFARKYDIYLFGSRTNYDIVFFRLVELNTEDILDAYHTTIFESKLHSILHDALSSILLGSHFELTQNVQIELKFYFLSIMSEILRQSPLRLEEQKLLGNLKESLNNEILKVFNSQDLLGSFYRSRRKTYSMATNYYLRYSKEPLINRGFDFSLKKVLPSYVEDEDLEFKMNFFKHRLEVVTDAAIHSIQELIKEYTE